MKINTIKNYNINFKNNQAPKSEPLKKPENSIKHDAENPIKKGFEQLDVVKASLLAGVGFGARALYYVFDDTDMLDFTFDASKKLVEKNYKNTKGAKRAAALLGSWAAILIGVVGVVAGLYTVYNTPKSMYQGKVNAHKKAEEMDVYLESNRVEKDLYNEVGQKAKEAKTSEEQEKVRQQYTKLQMAKNQTPSFINQNFANFNKTI